MSNGTIYLSGGMEKSNDNGASWRKDCSAKLILNEYVPIDITALDSAFSKAHGAVYMSKDVDHILQYKSNIRRQFIYTDLRLIRDNSDAVIAYYDESFRLGAGSFAECQAAYDFEKPLFVVSAYPKITDIPGWLKALSTKLFFSFEDLFIYLEALPSDILKTDKYGNHSAKDQYLCSLCGSVFGKSRHHFVSKVSPLYCKPCVDLVTKTYEGQADRYEFAVNYLNEIKETI